MAKFIQDSYENTNTNNVKSVSASKQMHSEVKNKVTVPMYFYNVIVPQLGNYYDLYPVDFNSKPVVCCPLHDEDTPSCRYYEETDSFYCFGCGKGGSVVELHRYFVEKMNGVKPEKDEAVYFLFNYFVKGKELDTFKQENALPKEKLNTDAEIVKLNFYRHNLEQSISFDRTLRLEVKKEMWELLDKIDLLLSKDLIKATEAETLIRAKVRELITAEATIKQHKKIEFKQN